MIFSFNNVIRLATMGTTVGRYCLRVDAEYMRYDNRPTEAYTGRSRVMFFDRLGVPF